MIQRQEEKKGGISLAKTLSIIEDEGEEPATIAQHFSSQKGPLRGGRAEKRAEVRPADSVAGDSLY